MGESAPSPPPEKSSLPEVMRSMAPYLNIGWMLMMSIVLWGGIGYWADSYFKTKPLLLALGAVLGIVVGMTHFLVTVLRNTRKGSGRK